MIKVVPDANIILSGMISRYGAPRKILDFALAKKIVLYGNDETYKEFCEKIFLPRLQKYLRAQFFTPEKMMLDYKSFINMVEPFDTLSGINIVEKDPDDDVYFRVAKASNAKVIVTGDKAVLGVKKYDGILVVSATNFLNSFQKLGSSKFF